MIKFENEYGKFEVKIGEVYDFDIVDVATGEAYPHSEIRVIGESKNEIKTSYENDLVCINKNFICHVELSDEA